MSFFKSLTLTFAMYSKIPMPVVEWDDTSMEWVFSCFPLVGVVIGVVLWGWLQLASWLSLGSVFTGAIAIFIPIALSGGIHLDGLCDTCDALGSHQSRKRKLEIMKDSHIGAFGVIGCLLYLLVFLGAWSEVTLSPRNILLLSAIPVLSRCWTGLAAVTRKNARGTGLLATFTGSSSSVWNKGILLLWLLAGLVGVSLFSIAGRWTAVAGAVLAVYYYHMTEKEFGGITGDLAGWYLQMLELVMVLAVALAGKGGI